MSVVREKTTARAFLKQSAGSACSPVALKVGREGLGGTAKLCSAVTHPGPALALHVVAVCKQAHVLAQRMQQEPLEAAGQPVVFLPARLALKTQAQLRLQQAERSQGYTLPPQESTQRGI